jgi:UDP-N-acetylglucosamine 1-carboxyvinyltransferase
LEIEGGRPLLGSTHVAGSKNAALPIMAASLLADGPIELVGVPRLRDVEMLTTLLESLGSEVRGFGGEPGSTHRPAAPGLQIRSVDDQQVEVATDIARHFRASICVLGPLVARRGLAVVPLPGGCSIGDRPIDLHLRGLRALGARIHVERDRVVAEAGRLRGARIDMLGPQGPTVTGTANVLCAATLARGRTVIDGAAREPEIVDLGRFLVGLGARIRGLGSSRIVIDGVERLGAGTHRIIPDRIEAGTLLLAAVATHGEIVLRGAPVADMALLLRLLRQLGADLTVRESDVWIRATRRPRALSAVARPFPGLATDLQAQLITVLAQADGRSVIRDTVFPDRFAHLEQLRKFGAQIERRGSTAYVSGTKRLAAADAVATDLRASAALVIAALAACGRSRVVRAELLDRGYEKFDEKLRSLGARVERYEGCTARKVESAESQQVRCSDTVCTVA